MAIIEGLQAPFLMEQTPDTIDPHELARHPSELATERADSLFGTLDSWKLSWAEQRDDESDMQFFLRLQNLDFWDETVAALHGDEQQYDTFLKNAAIRNPDHYFKNPDIFKEVIDDKERERFIELYLIDVANLKQHYHRLSAIATPAQLQHHADVILSYDKDTSYFSNTTLLMAALHSSLPQSERSNACENVITTTDWSKTKIPYWNNVGYRLDQPKEGPVSFLQAYDDAVKAGLLDKATLIQSFEKSKPKEDAEEYEKFRYASNEALLKLKNILPSDKNPGEILTDMFRTVAKFSVSVASDYDIYDLLQSGLVNESDLETASQVLDEQQRADIQIFLDYQQEHPYSKLRKGVGKAKHYDDELIQNLYQEHCVEKKPIADNLLVVEDKRYELLQNIVRYGGDLVEEQQELAWEMLTQKDKTGKPPMNVTYNWDKIAPLFQNDPERLKALVDNNIANGGQINYAFWQEWGAYTSLSSEELKDRFKSESSHNYLSNTVNTFRSQLDQTAENGLFTQQEMVEIISDRLNNFYTYDNDKEEVVNLCLRHLGKNASRQLLHGLDEKFPELEAYHQEVAAMPALDSMDYYDLYDLIWKSPNNTSLYVDNNFELVVDTCLERLGGDHVIDTLPYFLRLMNMRQKAKLHDIMMSNPAYTEQYLAATCHKNVSAFMDANREIASASRPDPLAVVVPKSYKSLLRRLQAKSHRSQSRSRDHLLTNYALHYDLVHRLEAFDGLPEGVKKLRGKNDEKNELRALELLAVLYESAGVTDVSQIESLSREDCETLATESIAHDAGLTADSSQILVANLRAQGIDLAKFDVWMLTSFRSEKLKTYYSEFLQHLGSGGNLQTWKFETPTGNNLPKDITGEVLDAWKQEAVLPVRLDGGKDYMFQFGHDLKGIYLCGARPSNNCLHYAYGLNQRGLAGLLNADSKMLTILNSKGKSAGNAILRIVDNQGAANLMLEPLYDGETDDFSKAEMHRATVAAAEIHARQVGLPFVVGKVKDSLTTDAAQKLYKLRSKLGHQFVATLASKAPYTYTDTSGLGNKPAIVTVLTEVPKAA